MNQLGNQVPQLDPSCSTWVDILCYRAASQPDRLAFRFLPDGESNAETLTYGELDRYSRAIAAQLQAIGLSGERALLLYPPGLDYLTAFFGCLYAGVVAVPAYPPRNQRNTPRILSVVTDAKAAIALTTTGILSQVKSLLTEKTDLSHLQWLTTNNLELNIEKNWQNPGVQTETLAFLQYTSGSTGTPKGVMVSHGNLIHNAAITYQVMEHSPNCQFVSWLPTYHDMGLIGGILQPLYGGFPCTLMPPASFLQRPYRWLKAISDYGGTTSGAPNFAYDLCVTKITDEQKKTLDLSRWNVAFNGAEPIRHETLARFSEAFAECGFRPEAFYPCYGMAETTLMVSGSVKSARYPQKSVDKEAFERNRIRDCETVENTVTLVGCGHAVPDMQIAIVNPDNFTRCGVDVVGEVWVSGPSVCQGYWHRPEATQETFGAYLADTGEGPFLRTGDLGFLDKEELYITGRVKDLIIIRGRNLYPQDIELAAERSHAAFRASGTAAFTVAVEGEEKLVVVQELEFRAKPNLEEAIAAIRQAVAEEFEVQVYGVVLIKPGSIPKTSSGKIQRRACRTLFLEGELKIVGESILASSTEETSAANWDRETLLGLSPEQRQIQLISYLQNCVASLLKQPVSQIEAQVSLSRLGIDSLMAFDLKNRIEIDLGLAISVVDLFEGISIAEIAEKAERVLETQPAIADIPAIDRNGELPVGLAQERLWFLDRLEPENPFYNVAIALRISGELDPVILAASIQELVSRHEVLRTGFPEVKGRPIQQIEPAVEVTLPISDFRMRSEAVEAFLLEEVRQPFDLSQAPLMRVHLVQLNERENILSLVLHHIISDGWSIGVFVRELAAIYQGLAEGKSPKLEALPIQYADFAAWQRQQQQTESLKRELEYWKRQLSGSLPVLKLPTDRPRPAIATFAGKKQFFEFPAALAAAVRELNRREGVTLFMTLLAAFKTLLYCYSQQEDIAVGSPVAGRDRTQTRDLIGFFINTIVLRTDLSGNPSFRDVLQRVRTVALEGYAHQELPFDKLVEELQPERNLSYNPLFQVMFILQNAAIPTVEIPGVTFTPQEVDLGTAKFDLKVSIWETADGFKGSFEYQTDLFDDATIARTIRDYERVLQQVANQPELHLTELKAMCDRSLQEWRQSQERELETVSLQKLKLTKRKAMRTV